MQSPYMPLDEDGCLILANALGDSPETAISVHRLRNGFCRSFVVGDPGQFDGAIIQENFLPTEPTAFGSDAGILWELLKLVEGWDCVNVASECATALGKIIEKETGSRVRYYGDVYHALYRPAARFQFRGERSGRRGMASAEKLGIILKDRRVVLLDQPVEGAVAAAGSEKTIEGLPQAGGLFVEAVPHGLHR